MEAEEYSARFTTSSEYRFCHLESTNFQLVMIAKNLMNKLP
jgi:hypothetical protein